MSYEMKNLRKEDLSLYYYIKDVILCDFLEIEENVTLEFSAELSSWNSTTNAYDSEVFVALTDMIPNPADRGRGWVYLDSVSGTTNRCEPFATVSGYRADGVQINGTPEQSSRVVVYDATGSGIISSQEYLIDYLDGRIVTSGTVSPKYVDYYWNYVSVVDEWAAVEASDPPVVVIDIQGTDKTGYQLGPGKKVVRKVDIHVFASNTAERNDLVETIYDGLYLRSWPLFDFPLGGILDYDGTWYGRKSNLNKLTTLFDRGIVSGYVGYLQFDSVTTRHVNLPLLMTRSRDEVMLSDLNAYRSKISFDLVSYTQV
jgi:hypothetical protein